MNESITTVFVVHPLALPRGEYSLQISAPELFWLRIDSVLKILNERIPQSVIELITKVFIEQSRLHRVS